MTNDVAIGLKIDPEIAEKVKLAHARLEITDVGATVEIEHEKQTLTFRQSEIDEIVEARFEEIFEAVAKELKKAGRFGKLPSGVVLTGGSARVPGIVPYAKERLGVAARIGKPAGFAGVSEQVEGPEFATAIGLMLADGLEHRDRSTSVKVDAAIKKAGGIMSKLMARFK